MAEHLREQARACAELGSPLYAVLLDRLADDVLAGGPAADVLHGHEDDAGPSALALRLAGAVHRLVLAGQAPALAAHYPSTGGDGDPDAAWPAFRAVLCSRPDDVRAGLGSPPQTNEVGRSAALLGGLLHVAGPDPLPVRLWEIGASGGLNLRADQFRYQAADGASWGPAASPLVLAPAWDAVPAGTPARLDVVERVGGDLAPIDPTTEDGALRLASYVWPDQVERMRRLRGAVAVARQHPARLVRAGAADFVAGLRLSTGALTVVWHSVMWQYVPAPEREAVLDRLATLGGQATEAAPLAHVAFEPRRPAPGSAHRFLVVVQRWPGGAEQVLGEAPPHGLPVTWGAPAAGGAARRP
jgi:hypothetical protein